MEIMQINCLTHWGQVTYIYMRQWSYHQWFRLVAWLVPSYYLNQCLNIVNGTLGNKFQWNHNQNSNIFIPGNAFENVICNMVSISSQPQCVKIQNHNTKQAENHVHISVFLFQLSAEYQYTSGTHFLAISASFHVTSSLISTGNCCINGCPLC